MEHQRQSQWVGVALFVVGVAATASAQPTLQVMGPNWAPSATARSIQLFGTGFGTVSDTTVRVTLPGATQPTIVVPTSVTATTIVATIPASATNGTAQVDVMRGTVSGSLPFSVGTPGPATSGVTPPERVVGSGVLTMAFLNVTGPVITRVDWYAAGGSRTSFTPQSQPVGGTLSLTVPAVNQITVGLRYVGLASGAGATPQLSQLFLFDLIAPQISSQSRTRVPSGSPPSSHVLFGKFPTPGSQATAPIVRLTGPSGSVTPVLTGWSANQLSFDLPASMLTAASIVTIQVEVPLSPVATSNSVELIVFGPPPSIFSLSPPVAGLNADIPLHIGGADFLPLPAVTFTSPGGSPTPLMVLTADSNNLTTTIPASLTTQPGAGTVRVTTPAGVASATLALVRPVCQPGFFAPSGAVTCAACPPGTFTPDAGSSACTPCAAGSFSDAGQVTCTTCAAGSASDAGAATCAACPAGSFSLPGAGGCAFCTPGTASTMTGAGSCVACTAGTHAPTSGATECLPCAAGSTSDAGQNQCTACLPGTVAADAGAAMCEACPAGSFSMNAMGTQCTLCPAGTASSVGANACTACLPGTFSATVGSAQCQTCQAGTFASAMGATSCTTCACDDGNACTTDTCDAAAGCVNAPISGCSLPDGGSAGGAAGGGSAGGSSGTAGGSSGTAGGSSGTAGGSSGTAGGSSGTAGGSSGTAGGSSGTAGGSSGTAGGSSGTAGGSSGSAGGSTSASVGGGAAGGMMMTEPMGCGCSSADPGWFALALALLLRPRRKS